MRYLIDTHDYEVKANHARSFLARGCSVRIHVQLRGREMRHDDLAIELCYRFIKDLAPIANCQRSPVLEGRDVTTILAPLTRTQE